MNYFAVKSITLSASNTVNEALSDNF